MLNQIIVSFVISAALLISGCQRSEGHEQMRSSTFNVFIQGHELRPATGATTSHNPVTPALTSSSPLEKNYVFGLVVILRTNSGFTVPKLMTRNPKYGITGVIMVREDAPIERVLDQNRPDIEIPLSKNINDYVFLIRSITDKTDWRYVELKPEQLVNPLVIPRIESLPTFASHPQEGEIASRLNEAKLDEAKRRAGEVGK